MTNDVCYPIWRGTDRNEALAAIGRLTEIGGGLEPDFDHLLTIYTATDPDIPFDFDRALSLDTSEVAHAQWMFGGGPPVPKLDLLIQRKHVGAILMINGDNINVDSPLRGARSM